MEFAQKLFSTRGGTLALAGIAALLATAIVLVYVNNYKSSVKTSGQPATVLVARKLIPKGTPGAQVAQGHLFQAARIRESQLRSGALSDPASLAGRVAGIDIYPGQQLTDAEFIASNGAIAGAITGNQRAIVLPLDGAHGLAGTLHAGDRVDVYAGFSLAPAGHPAMRLIAQAVPVLGAGNSGGGINSGATVNVTLKVSPQIAVDLAFASDNGKIWLVLRPPVGGSKSPPNLVTAETVILGTSSAQALKLLGGSR